MPKVKICGITNLEDALLCSKAGADALGFIFWKKSPRYITPSLVKKIIDNLDPFISSVGVFVDEDKKKVFDIAKYINLDVLQFHGKESVAYCNSFKSYFKVVKTFFPQQVKDSYICRFNVSGYLFDIGWDDKQKGLKSLPQSVLRKIASLRDKRVIVSGGLNPVNVSSCIKKIKPYAVDVASGVEVFPGKKDKKAVKLFIQKAKQY
jgi:phosphoribosylanthranilate isomerase